MRTSTQLKALLRSLAQKSNVEAEILINAGICPIKIMLYQSGIKVAIKWQNLRL